MYRVCIQSNVCAWEHERERERESARLGGMQGQMGEWEPGFCHLLECRERRDVILCLICSPSFPLVFH